MDTNEEIHAAFKVSICNFLFRGRTAAALWGVKHMIVIVLNLNASMLQTLSAIVNMLDNVYCNIV